MDDYEQVPTYGFGPREGKHVDLMYEILVAFAESQDVALPELLGYMDIVKHHLIQDMVQIMPDEEGDEPNDFDLSS